MFKYCLAFSSMRYTKARVIKCLQITTAEETETEFIYIVCRMAFVDC